MMNRVRGRLDAIAEKAPNVPERSWNKARRSAAQSTPPPVLPS
jgi:hypothetical protein